MKCLVAGLLMVAIVSFAFTYGAVNSVCNDLPDWA